jgi:hypothetical protein
MNEHYQIEYTRHLTDRDKEQGFVTFKLDPYRVAGVYGIEGGPREHMLKKILRYTAKGHSEREVLQEIICAANRRLEMISEDEMPKPLYDHETPMFLDDHPDAAEPAKTPPCCTREQAIAWCIANHIDFNERTLAAPSGWEWVKAGDKYYLSPTTDNATEYQCITPSSLHE